jgi:myo-inositol-1-phosphate synthase
MKFNAVLNVAFLHFQDIRPTKPGDALLEAQILDFDLVRQVQDEINKVKLFRGLFDPRFIGTSQHETATYILTEQEARSDAEALKCLRADIRYFKWRNGVVGHTTVIWSASVEPNSERVPSIRTANDLLDSIDLSEEERGGPLPPSLLYATAALLEGCSFVNGGSQNTLACPGLAELAQQQLGVYCLGTDFKAGQTKFKTAAVEYIRTMGMKPRVIASSNHLGNNDMRNLASAKAASNAKLKVKRDIFAPWQEEELDHKVSIMYTPFINDDKRDFVEYTSLGFLGQTHTMVTYTRASDSVLCVPLMIDAAVWCDYFSQRSWPYEKVAKALAYLFKVPEGAAQGVDPGFFRQMEELKSQVLAAHGSKAPKQRESLNGKRRVRIRAEEEKATEWAVPHDAKIICAGLACVDMQLNYATGGDGGEGIEKFEGEKSIGGGR